MQRNWPYAINLNVQEADDPLDVEDYGAMPIPYAVSEADANQPGTGGSTAALGGWHLTLNPNSERTDDAVEVLRAAMTDEFNLGMFDLWGGSAEATPVRHRGSRTGRADGPLHGHASGRR